MVVPETNKRCFMLTWTLLKSLHPTLTRVSSDFFCVLFSQVCSDHTKKRPLCLLSLFLITFAIEQ